jgi:aryl-alcohol dehydrogenase-like predicted oxidoreductase
MCIPVQCYLYSQYVPYPELFIIYSDELQLDFLYSQAIIREDTDMNNRKVGIDKSEIFPIALGCMGMSEFYGKSDDKASKELIIRALDEGVTMLDTADCYGAGHNERLIGSALKETGRDAFIATKFGIVRHKGRYERTIDNSPAYIRKALEESLKNLQRDHIDLYYIHRLDANTPVEESIGELSRLVDEGKIRNIGLSEVSAETIERAEKIHHIAALQTEYSLFTRHVEEKIMPLLKKNRTALIPYSPLGRGFLSGVYTQKSFSQEGDFRSMLPRFSADNFAHNKVLVDKLNNFAQSKGVSSSQIALSWLLHKDESIIPIPGTRQLKYLLQNISSVKIVLSSEEMTFLEELFYPGAVRGERYPEAGKVGIEE